MRIAGVIDRDGSAPAGLRRSAGFSLLEILIAMAVLSLGAASILALFAAAASTHRRAVDRTHAALMAERVFSEARMLYTPGKLVEDLERELAVSFPPDAGAYTYEALFFHPTEPGWTEDELVLGVTVRWRQSGAARAERFQTVLLPRVRLGAMPEEESRPRRAR